MNLLKKLASQSAVIFSARVLGAGMMFGAQAVMARLWGPALLGEYLVIIAAASFVAAFLPLGFHTVGTYFAAEYRARSQGGMIRRFALFAYGQWLVMAILFALFGLSLLKLIEPVGAIIEAHFTAAAVIAAANALIFVNSSLLVGLKRPFAGYIADMLVRPALVVAGLAVTLLVFNGDIGNFLNFFAIGYGVVGALHFLLSVWSLSRVTDSATPAPLKKEIGRWWRFAVPWVLIALATDLFFDIDLLILSTVLVPADLAIFGVCARIFSLIAFGVAAVYAVTLPDVFEAEALSDRTGFLNRIGDANLVASGLSLVLFAGAGLFGAFALLLFGSEFLAGSGPLAVLSLSLVVRSIFGPTSMVLSIYDRPYASLPAVAGGIVALIGANLVLVPAFGLMGAAFSALIAITIWSGSLWIITRRITGVDVSIMPRLTSMVDTRNAVKPAK